MKKNYLFIILPLIAAAVFGGCKKDDDKTPPLAASTQTWEIGGLIWSDVIHDPACNKTDYDAGSKNAPKSDCRNYTYEGRTYYYYSWPYVKENAARLCPSPWHLPSYDETLKLCWNQESGEFAAKWGLNGYAWGRSIDGIGERGNFWTWYLPESGAMMMHYDDILIQQGINWTLNTGAEVRCVK